MKAHVFALTVLALSIAGPGQSAEQAIALTRVGSGWRLSQHVPFDTTFLVAGRTRSGDPAYRILRLAPGGAATLDWAAAEAPAAILAWAGNEPRIRMQPGQACDAGMALDLGLLKEVGGAVAAAEISTTSAGQAAVEASREASRLDAESWKAVQDYNLYNPLRQDYLEKLREDDPGTYARVKEQDAQQELLNTGMALAREAAGAAYEQQQQWAKEAEILEKVVASLSASERSLERLTHEASEMERAGRDFGSQVAAQVNPTNADIGGVRRVCTAPARTADVIAIDPITGSRAAGPLVLEVRYDDGTKGRAVAFPASPSSDRWLATVFWPPAARNAEIQAIGGDGRRRSAGRIQAGRDPIDSALKQLRNQRKVAERKMKEARWLGKGGAAANSGVAIY